MYSSVTTFLAAGSASAGFLAGLAATRPRLRRLVAESAQTRWLAEHDTLTGLPNRASARHRFGLDAAASRADVIVLLDLDDFKTVNETWGHQVGDALLVAVAARLTTASRHIDAQAFRLGGDEFVLLLPPTHPHEALRQTTAILAELGTALPLTTALDIAQRGLGSPQHVVLATGQDYADALAAGPFAAGPAATAAGPAAVILTDGKTLAPDVRAFIASRVAQSSQSAPAAWAIGGQAVTATAGLPGYVKPLSGATRYETDIKVVQAAKAAGGVRQIGIATGSGFPDALTGGALTAATDGETGAGAVHAAPADGGPAQRAPAATDVGGAVRRDRRHQSSSGRPGDLRGERPESVA